MTSTGSDELLVPAPMLAKLVREVPAGDDLWFEPKWDGFRCLAARAGGEVELVSRSGRPLARYFPEVVAGLLGVPAERFVVDGELVATTGGRPDFAALMGRLHPAASRVEALARQAPATYLVFDLLALGGADLAPHPFAERRAALERLLAAPPAPIELSAATRDRDAGLRWLDAPPGAGIDGIVVKRAGDPYQPGRRAMFKVKRERTADCVVAGFRFHGGEPVVGSLLLGLHDAAGVLRHVGVVTSFPMARRRELAAELAAWAVPLADHPWRDGFATEGGYTGRLPGAAGRWTPAMGLDWVPLRPDRVAEVAYDQVDAGRLRHPARFRRWRPDRDAASCLTDQLEP